MIHAEPLCQDLLPLAESNAYLTQQIITYIGNKRALLPFLDSAVARVAKRLDKDKLRLADIFAGSGIVSRFFKQYASFILSNDLETYANVIGRCYLTNISDVDIKELRYWLDISKKIVEETWAPGFITEAYAPKDETAITPTDRVFYTRRNAIYLDTARKALNYVPGKIRHLLLAPLLSEASIHNNTSGVFKGFYKNREGVGCYGGQGRNALVRILGEIELRLPVFSNFECETRVCQEDANALVHHMPEVDLAYLDPPYNQHPYGSNYFMLNLLATGEHPGEISKISGIPVNWNRSRYNKRSEASDALFDLIRNCPAKNVLISYNSEGFIPYELFCSELSSMGKLTPFETEYNAFRGSRNLSSRALMLTEYLFLLEK